MSGGCCSPLGPGPVATVFYQTIQNAGVAEPQEAALNIINGTLADNPGNGSTDLTLHQQFAQSVGVALAQRRSLNFASMFSLADDAGNDSTDINGVSGFHATLHVDPTFTGTSLGSESNPYKSVTAAFAAGTALGLTTCLVLLAPGTTTTENLVFPTTGFWEVACQKSGGGAAASATINGTIDFSTTGQVKHTLTSLVVNGAVTGNQTVTGTPSRLYFTDVSFNSTITLTAATSRWRVWFDGKSNTGSVSEGGNTTGATTIAGEIYAWAWGFFGAVAWNTSSQFNNCNFATNSLVNTSGANAVSFLGCFFGAAGTVTFTVTAGSCVASFDGYSLSTIIGVGLVAAGVAGGLTVKNLVGVGSDQRQVSANIGATILSVRQPESLMVAECTVTILTPGTSGVITPNISYTDLNGTAQTKALLDQSTGAALALAVTSAAGTEAAGRFYFSQNGASALSYTTTGIVTAGALVYKIKMAVRQAT